MFILIVLSSIRVLELNNKLTNAKILVLKLLKQEVMIWL